MTKGTRYRPNRTAADIQRNGRGDFLASEATAASEELCSSVLCLMEVLNLLLNERTEPPKQPQRSDLTSDLESMAQT